MIVLVYILSENLLAGGGSRSPPLIADLSANKSIFYALPKGRRPKKWHFLAERSVKGGGVLVVWPLKKHFTYESFFI